MLLFLKEFWTTNFRFFVSKDKKYYFDDDSKVYNCLIYEKKRLYLMVVLVQKTGNIM